MLTGQRPLDLVLLVDILPYRVWFQFGPRLLAVILQRSLEQQKSEVA